MSFSRSVSHLFADGTHRASLSMLSDAVFAELPRRDQRERAIQYVQGLLETTGRKSVRNIAAQVDDSAAEQRLHHFVTSSPWEWSTVRERLAGYVERHAGPEAWVVRPMVIPKSGERSVGVQRRWFPAVGQILGAQHALGTWAASAAGGSPVGWRLQLTEQWTTAAARRAAAVPDGIGAETVEECLLAACLETPAVGSSRPFVVDVPEADALDVVAMLVRDGVPFVVRVPDDLRVVVEGPAPAGYESGAHAAWRVARAFRDRARPVPVEQPDGTTAVGLAGTVPVRIPVRRGTDPATPPAGLRLFGGGPPGADWPSELWLTDRVEAAPESLPRWTVLAGLVDRDSARITEEVGIRDFTGRSFGGWHRHATLVSAAHVVRAQTEETVSAAGTARVA